MAAAVTRAENFMVDVGFVMLVDSVKFYAEQGADDRFLAMHGEVVVGG